MGRRRDEVGTESGEKRVKNHKWKMECGCEEFCER